MSQAIVLFSGGIDSTTALYWALHRYERVFPVTFDYGQRHRLEIRMARKLARKLKLSHTILKINLNKVGGSSLTDNSLPLPQYETLEEIETGVPLTYVPFRNGIFLSLAAAWAEVHGVHDIICGFNVIDSPNYPDTSEAFVQAMEKAIHCGTRAVFGDQGIKILAPLVKMKKSEIIQLGISLGADYSYSLSCYRGEEIPCLKCSSCLLRKRGWEELGLEDPLIGRLKKEGKI